MSSMDEDFPGAALRVTGISGIMRGAYENRDPADIWNPLVERTKADPADAAAWMDIAVLMQARGDREQALKVQSAAITLQPVFYRTFGTGKGPRVAAFMTAGDLMANTPIDFLLQGSDATLIYVYVDARTERLPDLPPVDAAFLAIGQSTENQAVLKNVTRLIADWQGPPVMNGTPGRIEALTRDGVAEMLGGAEKVLAPKTALVTRNDLAALAAGSASLEAFLPGCAFPLVVRPAGTHAGKGMERIDLPTDLDPYVAEQEGQEFYVAPFVDYSGPDRLYRKQRIAFINGKAFASHMAVSEHWIVHYLSAGMFSNPGRRREEQLWMETFDSDFAERHAQAFAMLVETIVLDYFGIDCAETPDGRLLVFEVDVAMIVHDMDSEIVFPYKKPVMRNLFNSFQDALFAKRVAGGAR